MTIPAYKTPLWDMRKRREAELINRYISHTDHVLDIGCGDLSITKHIKGAVYGIDPEVKTDENVRIFNGIAEDLPFKDSTFDIIYSVATFHHIKDKDRAISEIKRVLKPRGLLIIIDNIESAVVDTMRIVTYPLRVPFTIMSMRRIRQQTIEISGFGYHVHNRLSELVRHISNNFYVIKIIRTGEMSNYFEFIVTNKFISWIITRVDKILPRIPYRGFIVAMNEGRRFLYDEK